MISVDLMRARNALSSVRDLLDKPKRFKSCYRSYVDSLCPTILTNGLGQALATELSAAGSAPKSDEERAHYEIYKALNDWLCRKSGGIFTGKEDILQAIMEGTEEDYILAQMEAISWIEWHKKFCRAFFPPKKGTKD